MAAAAAAAALRNLVSKVRIPGAAALRASPAPSPQATLPTLPPPKADLENALLVKNNIDSSESFELFASGNLIAQHCEQTEQIISQVSERHAQASRAIRSLTFKYFCTGVVLGSINHLIEGYYYDKAEFELEEGQVAVEAE